MELSYTYLRTKEVVNVVDGRKLGKICDVVFCYPENRVTGIVVPGGVGLFWRKREEFIEMRNIVKIGDDVILVNIRSQPKPSGKKTHCEECPPPRGSTRPFYTPAPFPPDGGQGNERRNFEDYE